MTEISLVSSLVICFFLVLSIVLAIVTEDDSMRCLWIVNIVLDMALLLANLSFGIPGFGSNLLAAAPVLAIGVAIPLALMVALPFALRAWVRRSSLPRMSSSPVRERYDFVESVWRPAYEQDLRIAARRRWYLRIAAVAVGWWLGGRLWKGSK